MAGEIPSIPEAAPRPASAAPPPITERSIPGDVAGRGRELVRRWWMRTPAMRTRILASYVVLLSLWSCLAIFAVHKVLALRLEDRTSAALQQETLEFERLLAEGRDPQTGRPFATVRDALDVFFARNIPSNEEALLAFVGGRLYSSNLDRYPLARLPPRVVADWSALSRRARHEPERSTGRFRTAAGEAYFRATSVRGADGGAGSLVVTILPVGEAKEIRELLTYGIAVTFFLLALASAGAWLFAGRVVAPVRQLTDTARSISQSDLTRRIRINGAGEAAEMARTFNDMLDRLAAVFRSQREFVRDASHELRNPLTISRGHLELLGEDPEERDRTLAIVIDELDRMGRIVDDLQVLTEAERPDFLEYAPVDLENLARELATKASALGPRDWRLEAARASGTLVADRHRLTEAMLNLAHNAVAHTERGDIIVIGVAADADEVRLWVQDTGPGIAEDEQRRILERFVRGSGANRRYRGSGLGLAIVKSIAEAHGGEVRVNSRRGAGSLFTIALPRSAHEGER